MAKVPEPKNTIASKIDAFYESKGGGATRYHLGCSGLGHACDRKIWMDFRWVSEEEFPGRILRLFERGANEEYQVADWLKAIGLDLKNTGDDQLFVDLGSHVGGSVDGNILGGYPGSEKTKAILEIKTHSKKSFDDVVKKGVRKSKPMHWVQMNCYAYALGYDRMLYFAVCKDNDSIHTEWLDFDPETAEKYIERGHRLATQDEVPPPLSDNPSWFECKFCHYHGLCFQDDNVEIQKSCRTCRYATACEDSTWFCEYHSGEIAKEYQKEGCQKWELHDDIKELQG